MPGLATTALGDHCHVSDALWKAAGATTGDPLRCTKLMLVAGGAVADTSGNHATTPLHQAGSVGNTEAAEALLLWGADIGATDNAGDTPLHVASLNGQTATVEALLSKCADVEAKNTRGSTPLHWASQHGHTRTAQALLANGADIEAKSNDGATPLHFASYGGYFGTVEVLLANWGADIEAKDEDEATLRSTGRRSTARPPRRTGCSPRAPTSRRGTPMEWHRFTGHQMGATPPR